MIKSHLMPHHFLMWIVFGIVVLVMLALDLGVFQKGAHEVKFHEALLRSAAWVLLALFFNAGIYFTSGREPALQFLTGYLLEESLSIDNLFVFLLIFSYFKVPAQYQHHVLFWGIVGAVLMRALFIGAGISLIHRFEWLIYVFGVFLIYTGIKLAFEKEKEIRPEQNPILKFFKKLIPVTSDYHGDKFFVKREGKTWATLLFVVLIVVETTDVIFAVDSIPAVLAVTTDPFIVYTSNIFAILGLRSLYFALSGLMQLFHHLHYGLALILVFIGAKMLMAEFFTIPIGIALSIIAGILGVSIVASLVFPEKEKADKGHQAFGR